MGESLIISSVSDGSDQLGFFFVAQVKLDGDIYIQNVKSYFTTIFKKKDKSFEFEFESVVRDVVTHLPWAFQSERSTVCHNFSDGSHLSVA